jgi:hypothetical protein
MEIARYEKRHTKALLESANVRSTIAQIVVPRRKVKDVLTELHYGSSGGNLVINKTLNKISQTFYWLQERADIGKYADSATLVQPVAARVPEIWAKCTSIISGHLSNE